MAFMVDIIPYDMREQGFSMLAGFGRVGPLLAFGFAYWFLSLHWDTYTLFWSVTASVNLLVFMFTLFLLPESMPREQQKPFSVRNLNPFIYYWRALKLILKQPFLIGVCFFVFVINFGYGAFGIA